MRSGGLISLGMGEAAPPESALWSDAMTQPYELSVAEIADKIESRDLSVVELMESLLSRCDALEPTLKVWVTLDPGAALKAAHESQRELEESGPRGPLHGIPIGVKDIFNTKGVKTTAGSSIYADFIPGFDSTAVARLKDAGAIIMGKTVTTEFAFLDPPPTRNPWDVAHTPGGSSTGSAVGVAARMFPAALGSQTGGSVTRPASYNGVVGLKPTFGRISRYGVFPVAWSLDTVGTLTRTVEDAALLLNALAGHDTSDQSTSSQPVPDYRESLGSEKTPLHIGLVRSHFFERGDTEVRTRTEETAGRLTDAGAVVEEASVDDSFEEVLAAHRVLMAVQGAAVHQADFGKHADDYSARIRALIEEGMNTSALPYVHAQRVQNRFRRSMEKAIKGFDILLTPSTASPAPRDLTTIGEPAFQAPWTTCGFPTITIPFGLSETGLPLGLQLSAAPFEEKALLSAARWCERVLDFQLSPPL